MNKVAISEISVEEFAKLLEEVRSQFERGNMDAVLGINERMRSVGYRLQVSQGTLRIENCTGPQVTDSNVNIVRNRWG